MKSRTIIKYVFVVLLLFKGGFIYASADSLRLSSEFIYFTKGDFCNDVFLTTDDSFTASVKISCYQLQKNGDSLLAYTLVVPKVHFQKGINKKTLSFKNNKAKHYLLPVLAGVVQQYHIVPPGKYIISVQLLKDTVLVTQNILQDIDSGLNMSSALYSGITNIFDEAGSGKSGGIVHNFIEQQNTSDVGWPNAERIFTHSRFYIIRYCKRHQLTAKQYSDGSSLFVDLYKDSWFLGRYKLRKGQSVANQIKRARDALGEHAGALTDNDLGSYQSLASQFRALMDNDKDNKELTGTVSLSANLSNDDEPFSTADNNYYEAQGLFEFPVMGIPVQLEGYYTSQDRHRQVKASYVHFHYDADKAKEKLLGLISSYNQRYEQTLSQGTGFRMIYGNYISQLEAQKATALNKLQEDNPVSGDDAQQLLPQLEARAKFAEDSISGLMAGKADSSAGFQKLQKARAAVQDKYQRAVALYQKAEAFDEKINYYRQLLQQYKTTLYYDSALVYQKLKNIRDVDNRSYKDMAKQAASLLPDGKVKGLMSGLTEFDAGMFPEYLSDYTMSGQMMKGVNVGYDVGFAKVGVTYGNTEYVSGYDDVTTYKSYSARVALKPIANQNIGFVYYGYSPARKLLDKNDFFKSEDLSLPSFRNPVHIISTVYTGKISDYVQLDGEFAFSNEQGQSYEAASQVSFNEKAAYNIHLTGNIPNTPLSIDAAYEHAGKSFENSTLPVLMSGTQSVVINGSGALFHSRLAFSVNYNHLLQNSLLTTGHNTQWGFDLNTNFRRFPDVYLSYKPFSSFRSFTDTLNVPQRPILGSVWIGRANYQVKRLGKAWRFSVLFNNNRSLVDTIKYNSTLIQGTAIYTEGGLMASVNAGVSRINATEADQYAALNNNEFAGLTAAFPLLRNLNLSAGLDAAVSQFGWSKAGVSLGGIYTFKKLPLMLRLNFRNSNYRLEDHAAWKSLYFGTIQMSWRFKMKLKDK